MGQERKGVRRTCKEPISVRQAVRQARHPLLPTQLSPLHLESLPCLTRGHVTPKLVSCRGWGGRGKCLNTDSNSKLLCVQWVCMGGVRVWGGVCLFVYSFNIDLFALLILVKCISSFVYFSIFSLHIFSIIVFCVCVFYIYFLSRRNRYVNHFPLRTVDGLCTKGISRHHLITVARHVAITYPSNRSGKKIKLTLK